jgi:hypothetical protein
MINLSRREFLLDRIDAPGTSNLYYDFFLHFLNKLMALSWVNPPLKVYLGKTCDFS